MSAWSRDGLSVRWLGGGLWVAAEGGGLLVDAPPGVTAALGDDLPDVQAVLLTSGRLASVGGLVELLVALEPHRTSGVPLSLRFTLGEERGPALAETWVGGWPDRYPLTLDAVRPGATLDVGPLAVHTVPITAGEPVWRTGAIEPRSAVAVRIGFGDERVAWVPGAAPGNAVRRACDGAVLAVVEVGVRPWPRSERRWRLSLADAVELGGGAEELWVVGDDGRFVGEDA